MSSVKLHTFDLRVAMADGTVHENVRPTQIAQRAYELAAAKNNWPDFKSAPFTYLAFNAYHQLKAENKYSGTFSQFTDRDCLLVEPMEEEELPDGQKIAKTVEVNPTEENLPGSPIT